MSSLESEMRAAGLSDADIEDATGHAPTSIHRRARRPEPDLERGPTIIPWMAAAIVVVVLVAVGVVGW